MCNSWKKCGYFSPTLYPCNVMLKWSIPLKNKHIFYLLRNLYLCAFASTKIAPKRKSLYADCGRRGFHIYADLGKRGIASRALSSTRFCSMIRMFPIRTHFALLRLPVGNAELFRHVSWNKIDNPCLNYFDTICWTYFDRTIFASWNYFDIFFNLHIGSA